MTNAPLDPHAQQLLYDASVVGNRSTELYFEWVKQMLSLSFAALTALVALQRSYTPDNDLARCLLWCTFLSLTASVVCAALDLRGASQGLRAQSRQMAEDVQKPFENRSAYHAGSPPRLAKIASDSLPWVLALSVSFLCAFGIANSL